ncbi:hypothetical protein CHELA40_11001 [Chelatococcus asaccharovorans]|nr:hypothetical protein CHELA40_11001 [Chelatococcus asaccharovorans]CAH1685617.1 hypothetical protein CHELA17_64596 [Chelatococcus asaccharovorans]
MPRRAKKLGSASRDAEDGAATIITLLFAGRYPFLVQKSEQLAELGDKLDARRPEPLANLVLATIPERLGLAEHGAAMLAQCHSRFPLVLAASELDEAELLDDTDIAPHRRAVEFKMLCEFGQADGLAPCDCPEKGILRDVDANRRQRGIVERGNLASCDPQIGAVAGCRHGCVYIPLF